MAEKSPRRSDEIIDELVNYSDLNPEARYTVAFPAGDFYECDELFWDDDNNGEEFEVGENGYEDWPVAVFHITRAIQEASNPARYNDWLSVSRRHMPSDVTSDGRLLYSAEKGLFLDHGRILDTPRTDL